MNKILVFIVLSISLYGSQILGKIDRFDLPYLNIKNIKAKIDTGAKTSSLHCMSIKPTKDGFVKFIVLDKSHKKYTGDYIKKKILRIGEVKSSNGSKEKRYFIKTPILIYNKKYMMELSLSFRGDMKYPLLIGRELIKQDFLVDVTKTNLSYRFKNNNN